MHPNIEVNRYFKYSLLVICVVTVCVWVSGTLLDRYIFSKLLDATQLTLSNSAQSLTVRSSAELEHVFDAINYLWPLSQQQMVPSLAVTSLPEDFPQIKNMKRKKRLFLRVLLPLALLENQTIAQQRLLIEQMYSEPDKIPHPDTMVGKALDKLTKRYRVEDDFVMKSRLSLLLGRLDEIPPSLVLAQGVIESGWGSSRFAIQGNSLFGQWTYDSSQGIPPRNRPSNSKHYVRAFPDLLSSVKAYMKNLNTGRAYREFRDIRKQMRSSGLELEAEALAAGLKRYSERGQYYVDYVRKVIHNNDLRALDKLTLASVVNQPYSTRVTVNNP